MKKALVLCLILFFALPLAFSEAGNRLEIPDGPGGYFTIPEDNRLGVYPFIMLIHDWWGLDEAMIQTANRFREEGFAVFAIDLYANRIPQNVVEAYGYHRQLSDPRALLDLKKTLQYFKNHPSINHRRMGVIGWSRGAKLALDLAIEKPKQVQVLGMYYGSLITDEKLEPLRAPLIAFFASKDLSIPEDTLHDFEFRLNQTHHRSEVHVYPDTGHGFFHPFNQTFDPKVAEDSWSKVVEYFKINLA